MILLSGYVHLHPTLDNYFELAGVLILKKLPIPLSKLSNEDILFVSPFYKSIRENEEQIFHALFFRLTGNPQPIIFFSFLSKEAAIAKDEFGIISLSGSFYVRLPVRKEELLQAIQNPSPIPNEELTKFRLDLYKKLVNGRILELKHGGKLTIVDRVIAPLSGICQAAKTRPALYSKVSQQLKNVQAYMQEPEISKLIRFMKSIPPSEEKYFIHLSEFINTLELISAEGDIETPDTAHLIILIEKLDKAFSFVTTQ